MSIIILTCLFQKQPRRYGLQNRSSATGAKNLNLQLGQRTYPGDTGRKLNVHKTFRRRPGRLMYVQFTSCVYWVIMKSFIGSSFLQNPFVNECLSLTIKNHDNVIDIFEVWFSPVRITNSHSVKINSKCSDIARTNQAIYYFIKKSPLHMFDWFQLRH